MRAGSSAIYVEAGDRVKRGQVLARLNVTVLQPQVNNLEAALEQARVGRPNSPTPNTAVR